MNTNNELLIHIYKTSDMGVSSIKAIINILKKKDNKIKDELGNELKEYEKIYKESKLLIKKNKINTGIPNIITSMMANNTIKAEINNDNSDAKIADILLRGYTMGIIEMEKKISDYKDKADKHILKLAKELLSFQKNSTENIKKYL